MTANQRILVIDDSPLVVEAISDGLGEYGVEVEGLSDPTELEQMQGLEQFNLILIDVQMPAMFGDDVALVIKGRHEREEILGKKNSNKAPIVLLSSLPELELAQRAQEAGADGYISKRRGFDGIIEDIRGWLDGSKRRQPES